MYGPARQPVAELMLQSTLTCPHYGHETTDTIPTSACQFPSSGVLLRPKKGGLLRLLLLRARSAPAIQQKPCGT